MVAAFEVNMLATCIRKCSRATSRPDIHVDVDIAKIQSWVFTTSVQVVRLASDKHPDWLEFFFSAVGLPTVVRPRLRTRSISLECNIWLHHNFSYSMWHKFTRYLCHCWWAIEDTLWIVLSILRWLPTWLLNSALGCNITYLIFPKDTYTPFNLDDLDQLKSPETPVPLTSVEHFKSCKHKSCKNAAWREQGLLKTRCLHEISGLLPCSWAMLYSIWNIEIKPCQQGFHNYFLRWFIVMYCLRKTSLTISHQLVHAKSISNDLHCANVH
jgi:hypothetical protein